VNCSSSGKVTQLQLPGLVLFGSIPSQLALLTNLTTLILSDNLLYGTIPSSFPSGLQVLDLARNKLIGAIFPVLATARLTTLNLAGNTFQSPLPAYSGWANTTDYITRCRTLILWIKQR